MKLIAPDPEVRVRFQNVYASTPLFTPTEQDFFACLQGLTQGRCLLFAKVNLADIIKPLSGKIGDRNQIDKKHVDFLICRHEDGMPMIGIELDDSSHNDRDRFKGDMIKNDAFAACGLPLLRLPVAEMHQLEKLVTELSHAWHHRSALLEAALVPAPEPAHLPMLMPALKPVAKPAPTLHARPVAQSLSPNHPPHGSWLGMSVRELAQAVA
jgi:hypothetical protein